MDGGDGGLFIGPPPPAVVKEAESANEAERFEEVFLTIFPSLLCIHNLKMATASVNIFYL